MAMQLKSSNRVDIRLSDRKTSVEAVFVGKSFAVTPVLYSLNRWTITHLPTGMVALPGVGVAQSTALRICKAYERGGAKMTARKGGKYRGQNAREFLRVARKVAPKFMVKLMHKKLRALRKAQP